VDHRSGESFGPAGAAAIGYGYQYDQAAVGSNIAFQNGGVAGALLGANALYIKYQSVENGGGVYQYESSSAGGPLLWEYRGPEDEDRVLFQPKISPEDMFCPFCKVGTQLDSAS